ncbi:MAG: hypothetical protein KAZ30_00260 [Candidatus Magasanikbacteria bacterium]|nr:hypothetical protein [Candidatus Magasanikbacteria bacterium]
MIKFGEKFALFLVATITAAFFGAVVLFQFQWWALVPTFIILGAILYFIVSHAGVRHFFWWLYGFSELGLLSLFVVVEWPSALVLITTLGVLGATVIMLWSRRVAAPIVFVREKPLRRAVSAALALALFGFCAFIEARVVFFPSTFTTIISPFIQAGFATLASFLLWSLYFQARLKDYFVPLSVMGVLIGQASLIIGLSSIGYLAGALIITWLWYVLQLLMRFHFGNRDIIWFKQRKFLVINAVLFGFFLSILRFL